MLDAAPDRPDRGQNAQNQEQQLEFPDSSESLFLMYTKIAEEEDNKMVEGWKREAEVILLFVHTAVSSFILLQILSQYHRWVCSLPLLQH
jgi:hypothetical protein